MHAANDAVGLEHDVASARRRDRGGVVDKTEGAGMLRQRLEIARDQAVLAGGLWLLHAHCIPVIESTRDK